MALIKEFVLQTFEDGNYAALIEVNAHRIRAQSVATVVLYKTEQLKKESGAQALNKSWQFIFTEDEIRLVEASEDLPTDWVEAWFHVHYCRIRQLANEAYAKRQADPECELTSNETMALEFYDAQDDTND